MDFLKIQEIYTQPFNDLLFKAQAQHRKYQQPNKIQLSKLISIKTGACPEDCSYCSQSGHHKTAVEKEKFLDVAQVVKLAKA